MRKLKRRGMRVVSHLKGWPPSRIKECLWRLPVAHGYTVVVRPRHYRKGPSLEGEIDYTRRIITIYVPEPFHPFVTSVYHRAKRIPGRRLKFRWLPRRVTIRSRREVIRFLYLHEYLHWYLWEVERRKAAAEAACERFALENFRKRSPVDRPVGLRVRSAPRDLRRAARR